MVDEPGLTSEEKALLRRYVSIDGDGNIVGNDNDVQVIKQTAGEYAVQIGEQRITFSVEELHAVSDRSIRLLESDQVIDRQRAVTALARIRNDRTVEPLIRAVGDADEQVAGLAVEALVEREDVHEQALKVAQQPDHPLHQSGLGYLKGVLGISMVWVPPGPFLMGSDKGQDPQAEVGMRFMKAVWMMRTIIQCGT